MDTQGGKIIMQRFLLLPLLVVGLVGPVKTQEIATKQSDPEDLKQVLLKLQDEEDRALLRADVDTLNRLWAEDILFPNDNGAVLTKAQRLNEARTHIHNFDVFKHDDIRVQVYNGNTGIVIVYSATLKKYGGKVSGGPRRASAVWVKRADGQWQMVEHQVTDMSGQ
jgi:ketosteroid isomerase-like protein